MLLHKAPDDSFWALLGGRVGEATDRLGSTTASQLNSIYDRILAHCGRCLSQDPPITLASRRRG